MSMFVNHFPPFPSSESNFQTSEHLAVCQYMQRTSRHLKSIYTCNCISCTHLQKTEIQGEIHGLLPSFCLWLSHEAPLTLPPSKEQWEREQASFTPPNSKPLLSGKKETLSKEKKNSWPTLCIGLLGALTPEMNELCHNTTCSWFVKHLMGSNWVNLRRVRGLPFV